MPVWRKHRRIISPTFNQRVLNTYVPVFDQQAKILVNQLRDKVGKGEFEIHKYMAACTLDMVFGELKELLFAIFDIKIIEYYSYNYCN